MTELIEGLRSHPDLLQGIGVAGFFCYILGFILVQTGVICGNGNLFALSNVLGAVLVLVSLVTAFNLASFLIQITYACIGLFGILRRLRAAGLARAPLQNPGGYTARTRRSSAKMAVVGTHKLPVSL